MVENNKAPQKSRANQAVKFSSYESRNNNRKPKYSKKRITILILSIIGLIAVAGSIAAYVVINSNNRLEISDEKKNKKIENADAYIKNNSSTSPETFTPKRGEVYGKIRIPSVGIEVAVTEGLPADGRQTQANQDLLDNTAAHVENTKQPGQNSQIYIAGHNYLQFNGLKNIKDKAEIFIDMPYGTYKYIVHATPVKNTNETVGMIVHKTRTEAIQSQLDYEELVIQSCYPLDAKTAVDERFLVYAYPEGKEAKISFPGYSDGSVNPVISKPASSAPQSSQPDNSVTSSVQSFG